MTSVASINGFGLPVSSRRALLRRAPVSWADSVQRQPAKPARDVRIGDKLRITNDGGEFHVEVLLLSEVRGPASVAQTLYRETEESRKRA